MKRLQGPLAGFLLLLIAITSCRKDDLSETSFEGNATATSTTTAAPKYIKVNFYGGANAYSSSEWNNWNTSSSLSSGNLKYSDGASSSVSMILSQQNSVSDNGSSYTATMAPKEVVRYSSYSSSNRTLYISGLDNAKTYNIELYASRSGTSNNSTRFTVNGSFIDVKTDDNSADKVTFSAISPSSGKITVSISKLNSYNYINGLVLTENGGTEIISVPPTTSTTTTTTSGRSVKVSLFGGANGYASSEWNNWNTYSSLSSGNLKYTDGTSSAISASLNQQNSVSDNGSAYSATMAPKEVIRYTSYSSSNRTLTISGLDNSRSYDLELYASRNGVSNNTTRFNIGTQTVDVKTDNNAGTKAAFTSLVPSSGKITVNISKLNSYNYLNGFMLTEKGSGGTVTPPPPPPPSTTTSTGTGKSYTLQAVSGEIYIPDASSRGWKGGDTLRIPAGTYSLIHIGKFKGSSGNPIVIINYGGQVRVDKMRFVDDAAYFKVTGTGDRNYTYGFRVSSKANAGVAMDLAHDVEICNVEVTGTEVGFYFKKAPVASEPISIYPNYVLSSFYIHHNYIHDTHGEGMYLGDTYPSADPYNNNLIPVRMDKVEIAYNIVDGTDWDGIQLSNARTGAKIHDNTVKNFGRINMGSQQSGIILGGNTTGDIYNNTVQNGTGNGIEAFGYGLIRIYNNTVENAGYDGTANGQESIFCNDIINGVESNAKQQIYCYNNIIKNPKPKGAIRVGAYHNNSLASSITNNTVYLANAASNWLTFYVVSNAVGSTISGNTVIR